MEHLKMGEQFWRVLAALLAVVLMALSPPAMAQIPGLSRSIPSLPPLGGDGMPPLADTDRYVRAIVDEALQAPRRLTRLARRSDRRLDVDPNGWPVVAREIVVIDLGMQARATILAAGYVIVREERLEALGITSTVLAPPRRLSLDRAMVALEQMNVEASIGYNHIHAPAGDITDAAYGGLAPAGVLSVRPRLGLIDSGVDPSHSALAGSPIAQRGFAGPPRMGAHGLAVASLMVGQSGSFRGGAPGEALLVADIYGGQSTGGASTALAQALDWLVSEDVPVINISLVGPRNPLVERAIARAQALGVIIVAAVGNDGPAAAPLYPASYPGVVGVTAVTGRNSVLPEAARGPQVDFSAPGADMAAAAQSGRWTTVRGTSFAAPIVAGLLARTSGTSLARSALDLGTPGPDPVYGAGLVGSASRTEPRSVGARGRLRQQ